MEKRGDVIGKLRGARSTAFLLAQVGAHAAARFAERLRELDLVPPHAGILRAVTANAGISQQALATLLGMVPSRLVTWLDELEQRNLLERRDDPEDRRLYALHVTDKGMKTMAEIGRVARTHDDALSASLTTNEREQLATLLSRIAEEQNLTSGVHPGFGEVGDAKTPKSARVRLSKVRASR